MTEIKFPEVTAQLTGKDGNAFAVVGHVTAAMKSTARQLRANGDDERADEIAAAAKEFPGQAFHSSSYDELLQLCINTVNVS